MLGRLRGIGQDNSSDHRFIAYDSQNRPYNAAGASAGTFEAWDDASFADYGIAANRMGTTTRYTADEPIGAVRYELWYWTGSLATSYPVHEDDLVPMAHAGTAQGGAASTITLAAGASATTDFYKDRPVRIVAGTGAGQVRSITAYNGATKIATVDKAWAVNPDNTSQYELMADATATLYAFNFA